MTGHDWPWCPQSKGGHGTSTLPVGDLSLKISEGGGPRVTVGWDLLMSVMAQGGDACDATRASKGRIQELKNALVQLESTRIN